MAEQRRELVINPLEATDPEIGRILWMLQDTRERTKRSLEGLDPAHSNRVPVPFENSIGVLLYHLAVIEADWLYAEVLERNIPEDVLALFPEGVRDDSGMLAAPDDRELTDHLRVLERIRDLVLQTYRSMSREEFRRPRSLPQYDVTPEWVLHHLMQHEAEHRGHIESLRHVIQASGG